MNKKFATILNGLSVLKLFQLFNGDFFCSKPIAFKKCVKVQAGCPKFGHTTSAIPKRNDENTDPNWC